MIIGMQADVMSLFSQGFQICIRQPDPAADFIEIEPALFDNLIHEGLERSLDLRHGSEKSVL
jgi:hypothetical protein